MYEDFGSITGTAKKKKKSKDTSSGKESITHTYMCVCTIQYLE
jgi:hypothetical protein